MLHRAGAAREPRRGGGGHVGARAVAAAALRERVSERVRERDERGGERGEHVDVVRRARAELELEARARACRRTRGRRLQQLSLRRASARRAPVAALRAEQPNTRCESE